MNSTRVSKITSNRSSEPRKVRRIWRFGHTEHSPFSKRNIDLQSHRPIFPSRSSHIFEIPPPTKNTVAKPARQLLLAQHWKQRPPSWLNRIEARCSVLKQSSKFSRESPSPSCTTNPVRRSQVGSYHMQFAQSQNSQDEASETKPLRDSKCTREKNGISKISLE